MNGKHFLKTLLMFTGMIIIGLIGVFLISYFNGGTDGEGGNSSSVGIAK
jgi:hypothetical protein